MDWPEVALHLHVVLHAPVHSGVQRLLLTQLPLFVPDICAMEDQPHTLRICSADAVHVATPSFKSHAV